MVCGPSKKSTKGPSSAGKATRPTRRNAFWGRPRAAGPQPAAFYSLALETGMRKSELCGLQWTDLDAQGRLTVRRPVVKPGPTTLIGPVKNKSPRVLALAPDTLDLLPDAPVAPDRGQAAQPAALPRPRADLREGVGGPPASPRRPGEPAVAGVRQADRGGGCPADQVPRHAPSCRVPEYAGSPCDLKVTRGDLANSLEVGPA